MRILVTGGSGFLGQHVVRLLQAAGHTVGSMPRRQLWDLSTAPLYSFGTPMKDLVDLVVHLAYPGSNGIGTTQTRMADLVDQQLRIDLNVVQACGQKGLRMIATGSVCAYPEQVTFPTTEDQLWEGRPEYWNEPYGQAKRMLLSLLQVYQRQYGLQYTYLILGNLYGPGDRSGHVIPSNIRRCLEATATSAPIIEVWGRGDASREFLYVEDAARAIVAAVDHAPVPEPLNICTGVETSMTELLHRIQEATQNWSAIWWDASKPVGQARRQFSHARATGVLGWTPQVGLVEGIQRTVAWVRGQEPS